MIKTWFFVKKFTLGKIGMTKSILFARIYENKNLLTN